MKGEGKAWRAHGSVSEQKTWSDESRQPMGCGHGAVEKVGDGRGGGSGW